MPMVRDARVTGPISRAVCHHEPVRAVDSISLPTFIELLKNHPLVREKKAYWVGCCLRSFRREKALATATVRRLAHNFNEGVLHFLRHPFQSEEHTSELQSPC